MIEGKPTGKSVLVFEADRTGYAIDQIRNPMTVGELKALLEDCDDDTLIILSHDRGYTYGSLNGSDYTFLEEFEAEDGDGFWA